MLTIKNIVYLNTTEASEHLGWCMSTFLVYAKDLERHTFKGKRGVFYRRDDLTQFLPMAEEPLEQRLANVARVVLRNTAMEELTPEWQRLKREVEEETAQP